MTSIELRPAIKNDLDSMLSLEHSVEVNRAWQMEHHFETGQISIQFRDVSLPRGLRLAYPRNPEILRKEWQNRSLILVACENRKVVGYMDLIQPAASKHAWILDLVVREDRRRKGIGSALLMAACEWASIRDFSDLILEMSIKNYAAICLAMKIGFEFNGHHDHYFPNQDIALFFHRSLK